MEYARKDSAMRDKPPLPPSSQAKPLSSNINKNNIIQVSEINIDVLKKKTKPIAMIEIPNINKRLTSSSSLCSKSVTSASTANNKSKIKLSQSNHDTKSRLEIMTDLECSNSRCVFHYDIII